MGGVRMVIKNTVREHDPPSYEGPPYVKKKFLENFQEFTIIGIWVKSTDNRYMINVGEGVDTVVVRLL